MNQNQQSMTDDEIDNNSKMENGHLRTIHDESPHLKYISKLVS